MKKGRNWDGTYLDSPQGLIAERDDLRSEVAMLKRALEIGLGFADCLECPTEAKITCVRSGGGHCVSILTDWSITKAKKEARNEDQL